MTNMYSSLALSYRQWHYRMTPQQFEKPGGPAMGFSTLQGANILSLLMLAPPHTIPSWLFVGLPFIVGTLAFAFVSRIYRANPAPSVYAKLTDAVPKRREFPAVYAYLFLSLVLFVGCLYVAVQSAA